jgi:hypothetical protein
MTVSPGYDEIILTTPASPQPCNSLACASAGRLAEVIVTYGMLNDPGACLYARQALWRESWGKSVPMCAACWNDTRQVAMKYRPRMTICDLTRPGRAGAARR